MTSPTSSHSATPGLNQGPARRASASAIEPIWLEWFALAGLLAFATWLLGLQGVWQLLLTSDHTGITLVIIIIFTGGTCWCGKRARELSRQRRAFTRLTTDPTLRPEDPSWVEEYLINLHHASRDPTAPIDLLLERTHGTHTTAWWVNGIQLKLGLLGKVIGFSILALEIGEIQNFDPAQTQDLLKRLTSGLGIALLTTMVGLIGNILLGLQLTRLDRFADEIVSRAQAHGIELGYVAASQRGT